VKPGKETSFSAGGPFHEEAEPEERLAGARSTYYQCAGVRQNSASKHGIESGYSSAESYSLTSDLLRAVPAGYRLQAGMDRETDLADSELMSAAYVGTAAQLEHFQLPDMARVKPLVGEYDHAVDVGAEVPQLLSGVTCQ